MQTLPLFKQPLETPLGTGRVLALDSKCRRCALGGQGPTTCMGAELVEGKNPELGTVLVIGESPTVEEERSGRPMTGQIGQRVRGLVSKYWSGDFVLDYSVKCHLGRDDAKLLPVAQEACAPYLREVFANAAPARVLVLGHIAARAVLGRPFRPFDARRNYTWIKHPSGKLVPVFVIMQPASVVRNRHLVKMTEEDAQWALQVPLDELNPPLDQSPDAVFHIVETAADARLAADKLREHDWFAYDCETAGRQFADFFRVACAALAPAEGDVAYVWSKRAFADQEALAELRSLMEDEALGKVGHNEKYDRLSLRAAFKILVAGFVLDTQLSRHLELTGCDASLNIVSEMVGMGGYWESFQAHLSTAKEMVKHARKKSKGGRQLRLLGEDEILTAAIDHPHEDVEAYAYALVKSPELERYNACDAIATARAARSRFGFTYVQQNKPARHIWRTVVYHATNAVEQLEAWGIHVNRPAMENFQRYTASQVAEVGQRIECYKINPDSPQQVAALLFDKLRLVNPHAPASRSTDKKALFAMQGKHPIIGDLREHRRLQKLNSSYGDLHQFIRADGRIHPQFKIDGTATGRLSCVEPALHQLPRKKDAEGHTEGKLIKDCFGVPDGYRLFQLDQSQIELRAAAILSGDKVMQAIFKAGVDFHTQSAKIIAPVFWKIAPEDVTEAHRSVTKSFVFGLIYGMTDQGLAARLNCSVDDAARLRKAILGEFRGLADWIDERLLFARRHGFIQTPFMGEIGRVRDLHEIGYTDNGVRFDDSNRKGMAARRTAENGSYNTPCQTWASDLVLHALSTRIVPWLQHDPHLGAKVIMTVHDSVLFQVREDQFEYVARIARDMMISYDTPIPLVVDLEHGMTWGSLEKLGLLQAVA